MPEDLRLEEPLAIIGEEDTISGFKALGFKAYPVKEAQEFRAALDEIVAKKTAVCLVQDKIYLSEEREINTFKKLTLPIFIPFANGSTPLTISTERSRGAKGTKSGLLEKIVKDIRLKATGTF